MLTSRRWNRLVACLCLMAYFLANTHTGLAIGLRAEETQTHDDAAHAEPGPVADEPVVECEHCNKRLKNIAIQPVDPISQTTSECHPTSAMDETGRCMDTSCPCCPKAPDGCPCPCPEGCAICNVAKMPSLNHDMHVPCPSVCLGDSMADEQFSYFPPLTAGLIRPPRA